MISFTLRSIVRQMSSSLQVVLVVAERILDLLGDHFDADHEVASMATAGIVHQSNSSIRPQGSVSR